jgi:release factor glutamine methyltransferase
MPTFAETLRCAERDLAPVAGDDARLEGEALLAHAHGIDRAHLLARLADTMPPDAGTVFGALLRRRIDREPLAYIVGHREFYGIEITCSPAALIPRPETEMLVAFALDESRRREGSITFADVGTGGGAVAIAIASNAPDSRITATDRSAQALELAAENAERHGVAHRIDLRCADLLDGLGTFDVIVANLPYVREGEWAALPPEIRDHEPRDALVGGPTGLEIVERLLRAAPQHLAGGAALAAEIGDAQGAAALEIGRACFPDAAVCVKNDLAGLDRVLIIRT